MRPARLASFSAVLALAMVLSGCIACELRVTNHTGGSIQFYTGHTKKAVHIASEATVTVPHTSGRVIVITQQDVVWEYAAVDIPDLPSETTKGFKRLTLPITVEPTGALTLVSGKKIEPTQKMSPEK